MMFMWVLLFASFACAILVDSKNDGSSSDQLFQERWMEIPLDPFNPFEDRTWKIRYFMNDKFAEAGKPLFIEVGGEWTIDGSALKSGPLYQLAKENQGMLVEVEHRYYGKSLPLEDFSSMFLEIDIVMEDLAYFIEHFKTINSGFGKSKVVLHGCSYAGMLATWMRLKYPHLVFASYASSAPLGVELNYPGYQEIVREAYADVSLSCVDAVKEGFDVTARLLETSEGRNKVKKALSGWECGNVYDMNSFHILSTMLNILNARDDSVKHEKETCRILTTDADQTSAFDRLIKLVLIQSKEKVICEEGSKTKEDVRNEKVWLRQACTQMSSFFTFNRPNLKHPFEMDATLQESVEKCAKEFGNKMTEKVLKTGNQRVISRYGGKKPEVSRVVTVQGMADPWVKNSSLENYTSEAPVFLVKGSQCMDFYEHDDDPTDLKLARKSVEDVIDKWLKEEP